MNMSGLVKRGRFEVGLHFHALRLTLFLVFFLFHSFRSPLIPHVISNLQSSGYDTFTIRNV